VQTRLPLSEVKVGDSIAVNGACLTVVSSQGQTFAADASPETLERTTLGTSRNGTRVNLERALCFGDRLGGHLVTGHVDSLAQVMARRRQGNMEVFEFKLDAGPLRLLVEKGSVAIDGISLTVNRVNEDGFSVAIIPHTLVETTLVDRQVGDAVNIETDLIGKYVARLLPAQGQDKEASRLDAEFLARHGFV
ncbi:MAG: riboflavin synthase, partial [Desulfuromonas sp.]